MTAIIERHRGLLWLVAREVLRIFKLWTQTVAAPILSAFLFIVVFGLSAATAVRLSRIRRGWKEADAFDEAFEAADQLPARSA